MDWLNIFSAVREARLAESQLQNERLARQNATEDQSFERSGQTRTATDWSDGRRRDTSVAALTAFRNMNRRIDAAGLRVDPEQATALRGAAFDRIAPALQASGFDTDSISAVREHVIQNPAVADDILAGIARSQAGGGGGGYAPRVVMQNGRPVYAAPGDEIGQESASDVHAQDRLEQAGTRIGVARDTLNQRVAEQSPDLIQAQSAARAEGAATGAAAAGLPRLDVVTDNAIQRIDELQDNEALDSIFGLPNLGRLSEGGFGAAGVVPGTPAADSLALLNTTIGDVQTAAYESLRGGGAITEAERESISRGLTNLDRAQSPQSALRALRALSRVLDDRRRAAHQAAERGRSGQSNAAPAQAAQPAAEARPAQPASPRVGSGARASAAQPSPRVGSGARASAAQPLRRSGETTDALLDRLVL